VHRESVGERCVLDVPGGKPARQLCVDPKRGAGQFGDERQPSLVRAARSHAAPSRVRGGPSAGNMAGQQIRGRPTKQPLLEVKGLRVFRL